MRDTGAAQCARTQSTKKTRTEQHAAPPDGVAEVVVRAVRRVVSVSRHAVLADLLEQKREPVEQRVPERQRQAHVERGRGGRGRGRGGRERGGGGRGGAAVGGGRTRQRVAVLERTIEGIAGEVHCTKGGAGEVHCTKDGAGAARAGVRVRRVQCNGPAA